MTVVHEPSCRTHRYTRCIAQREQKRRRGRRLITVRRRPGRARHVFGRPRRRAGGAALFVVAGHVSADRTRAHQGFVFRRTRHRTGFGAYRRDGASVLEATAVTAAVAAIVATIAAVCACHSLVCVVAAGATRETAVSVCGHAMPAPISSRAVRTSAFMTLMLEAAV